MSVRSSAGNNLPRGRIKGCRSRLSNSVRADALRAAGDGHGSRDYRILQRGAGDAVGGSAQGCRPLHPDRGAVDDVSATVGQRLQCDEMPSVAQVLATTPVPWPRRLCRSKKRFALAVVGFGDPAVNEDVEVRTSSVADDQLLLPVVFGVDDDGFERCRRCCRYPQGACAVWGVIPIRPSLLIQSMPPSNGCWRRRRASGLRCTSDWFVRERHSKAAGTASAAAPSL